MALGNLLVSIRASASEFAADMKAITRETREFEKAVKLPIQAAKDIGLALAGTGTAVVGSLLAMTKSAANYGDQINKASVQTGISTENLSRLKFVADQTESSFEGVANGLRFLTRNAAAAADGTKAQVAAFNELGVSVTDSSGALRPMNDLLLDVADKFSVMEDGTEKAALAQRIFGRAGMEMVPILNLGRAGIASMGDEAQRLGLVLSKEAAKAGDDFNDSMSGIGAAVLGLSNAIAQSLMPGLTGSSNALRDGISAVTGYAKEHETLTKLIFGTGAALAGTGGLLLGLAMVVPVVGQLVIGLKALSLAMTGSSALMSAMPLVAAGAAIVVMTAAVVALGVALWKLKSAFDASNQAQDDALKHTSEAAASTERAAAALKDHYNIEINRGSMSTKEWSEKIGQAAQAAAWFEGKTKTLTVAQKTNTAATVDATVKVKTLAAEIQRMTPVLFDLAANLSLHQTRAHQMFDETSREASDLVADLKRLANERAANENAANAKIQRDLDSHNKVVVGGILKTAGERTAADAKVAAAAAAESKKWQDVWTHAMGQVAADFGRGIADIIFEGKKFAETLGEIFKQLGKTIIQTLVTDAFTKVAKALSGKLFGNDEEGDGGGGGGILGGLGGLLGGGGEGGGGGSSSGSGSGSGLGGGLSGSLISGGLAAAGSIIGGLMGEGNAKRTEENTRETRDWLELQTTAWNPLFHQIEHLTEFTIQPLLREIKDILWEIRADALPALALSGGAVHASGVERERVLVLNIDGRQVATAVEPHIFTHSMNLAMKVTGSR